MTMLASGDPGPPDLFDVSGFKLATSTCHDEHTQSLARSTQPSNISNANPEIEMANGIGPVWCCWMMDMMVDHIFRVV